DITRQISESRQHDRDFRFELEIARAAKLMIEPKLSLRNSRISSTVTNATEVCILDHVGQRRRDEWRPVLPKQNESAVAIAEAAIDSDPRETKRRLTRSNRTDVAIVDAREITFEVKL